MTVFKGDRIRVAFVYFTMIYVLFGKPLPTIVFAQLTTDSQWTKPAKSLTIFQPGDAVKIQVWELKNRAVTERNEILSRDYLINSNGDIVIPIIGEVRVVGLTEIELMQTLQEKLGAYLADPYVLVRPLIRVTLQGAFENPGSYRIDPSDSFWDLVALGVPISNCDIEGIWVERGGKVILKKLLRSFEEGYSLDDVGIESGDQIIAPARGRIDFNFYINIINLLTSIFLLYLRLRTGYW